MVTAVFHLKNPLKPSVDQFRSWPSGDMLKVVFGIKIRMVGREILVWLQDWHGQLGSTFPDAEI